MITDLWEVLADGSESTAAWLPAKLVISEGCLSVGNGHKLYDGVCEKA